MTEFEMYERGQTSHKMSVGQREAGFDLLKQFCQTGVVTSGCSRRIALSAAAFEFECHPESHWPQPWTSHRNQVQDVHIGRDR
jgi:hypothetical protein